MGQSYGEWFEYVLSCVSQCSLANSEKLQREGIYLTHLYRLDCGADAIARHFGARRGDDPWQGGYIAPMKFAPVITAGREFVAGARTSNAPLEPRIVPRLWGVGPPPKADDPLRRIPHIRNIDSPFWIGNLRNSEFRCLIPATSVMLWGSETDYEGRRLQHWFAPKDAPLFAMAGVWKDDDVPGFALLMQDAKGAAKAAGCRSMPLILPGGGEWGNDAYQTWLHRAWGSGSGANSGTNSSGPSSGARALVERPSPVELTEISADMPPA